MNLSKKADYFLPSGQVPRFEQQAVALNFTYHNFCKLLRQSVAPRQCRLALKRANGLWQSWWNVVENKDYIERLQQVIFHLHKTDSRWMESVPVREVFQGRVIWEGPVEVFALTNHPKAKRCYPWSHVSGNKDEDERFVAVLEIPPVTSPETAVKVAIAAEARGKK